MAEGGKEFTLLTNEADDATQASLEDEAPVVNVKKSVWRKLEGKLLILLASFLSVTVYSLNKHFGNLPVGQFSSSIFLSSLLFLVPAQFFYKENITFSGKFKFIFVRAFLGGIGGLLKFWGAHVMDYGDSVTLGSLAPIFATLFARVMWKEKVSIFTLVALFIALPGIILVAKPTFIFGIPAGALNREQNPLVPLIPLSASIIYGLAFSTMRKVGTEVSPILVSILVSSMAVPDGILYQVAADDTFCLPSCHTDRIVLVLGGLALFLALIVLNRGLTLEKSGPGVLIRNCDIVFAYAMQIVFFGSIPDVLSVFGAILVISSAVIVTVNKLFFEQCCVYEI